jgi:hypothetical protein
MFITKKKCGKSIEQLLSTFSAPTQAPSLGWKLFYDYGLRQPTIAVVDIPSFYQAIILTLSASAPFLINMVKFLLGLSLKIFQQEEKII